VFGIHSPNKRPFTLTNDDIAFPYKVHETISTAVLVVVALIAPAVIIFLIAFLLIPGPTVPNSTPRSLVWRRKLWEWFVGWTGLALSCATAWIITNGMKNLFGSWRPDLLSRCNPDVTNIANYAVGGYPNTTDGSYVVTWQICQQTDRSLLDDGFRSFPSGHASFSAAGLIYLSLFLASKLAITIPFLAPRPYGNEPSYFSAFPSRMNSGSRTGHALDSSTDPYHKGESIEMQPNSMLSGAENATVAARNQSAAPPLYLFITIAVPIFTSIYITSTRYADFRHHGFDLLFGFVLGTVIAICSFRLYHLPISQGAGWAWGPRSRDRAFWAGIGVGSYATNKAEGPSVAARTGAMNSDLGAGPSARPAGTSGGMDRSVGNGAPAEDSRVV
jgi:membrane-associated phospholipid phosphatase